MKKIALINTGGTFSCTHSDQGLAPGLNADDILKIVGMDDELTILTEDFASIDSANITPKFWSELALKVREASKTCDGVVIIHGTDTMAYSASMLSFMLLHISIPVVLTGSQLPLTSALTDAIDNLKCACAMACSGLGGVYLVFNRKVMLGCRTAKVRTMSFDAFDSINYPLIGEFNAMGLQIKKKLAPVQNNLLDFSNKVSDRISVLKYFPGMDAGIFSYLIEKGYEGIFIEGFGLGGVPFQHSGVLSEIRKASDAGIPVLVGSQCRYEGSNLEVYETGFKVREVGGIPVNDMTQEATVTKLMWCLGKTKDRDEIQRLFRTNLSNEITLNA